MPPEPGSLAPLVVDEDSPTSHDLFAFVNAIGDLDEPILLADTSTTRRWNTLGAVSTQTVATSPSQMIDSTGTAGARAPSEVVILKLANISALSS